MAISTSASRSRAAPAGSSAAWIFPPICRRSHPDELLAKSAKAGVAPKLLLSNGSHEYWGRAAGLNHVSEDGKRDVAPSADVRIYYVAGTQHGAGGGPNPLVQNPTNPMDWSFFQRAMVVALNKWITDGTAPPASQIPAHR